PGHLSPLPRREAPRRSGHGAAGDRAHRRNQPGCLVSPREVLDFWFTDRVLKLCFERNDAFDAELRTELGAAVAHAQAGGFEAWRDTAEGTLALLILLDQMSRNIHRGSPQAFAADARALAIAEEAVEAGLERGFPFSWRRFFYLPFEHSESPQVH